MQIKINKETLGYGRVEGKYIIFEGDEFLKCTYLVTKSEEGDKKYLDFVANHDFEGEKDEVLSIGGFI